MAPASSPATVAAAFECDVLVLAARALRASRPRAELVAVGLRVRLLEASARARRAHLRGAW